MTLRLRWPARADARQETARSSADEADGAPAHGPARTACRWPWS